MSWPALLFWGLIAVGAVVRGPLLLYLFFVFSSFGTLAMAPSGGLGGVTILPESVCTVVLVVKLLWRRHAMNRAFALALNTSRLGYLTLFVVYACMTAYFLPRMFAGMVVVTSMAPGLRGGQPLEPTTQNLTQAAYLLISCGVVLAFAVVAEQPGFRKNFLRALFAGAIATIATGALDLLSQILGFAGLLAGFRTATYNLIVGVEIFDARRVVGLMTEASAYGGLCIKFLSALLFLRPSFEPRLRNRWVPAAIVGLFVMTVISTSSGSYVGLGVVALAYGASMLRRQRSRDRETRRALWLEIRLLGMLLVALLCALALEPSLLDPVYDWFDKIVLQKTQSDSYVERSLWTKTAMDGFFGTYGLGVGVGGARTSNWAVAILSNTGVMGTLFLVLFLAKITTARLPRTSDGADLLASLRFALIPIFAVMALSGTTTDFGVFQGSLCGLGAALLFAHKVRTPASREIMTFVEATPEADEREDRGRASLFTG